MKAIEGLRFAVSVALVSMFIAANGAGAQEVSQSSSTHESKTDALGKTTFDYIRYLSPKDLEDVTARMLREETEVQISEGTLYDGMGRPAETYKFSVPISATRTDRSSSPLSAATAGNVIVSGGNLNCEIRADNPHIGFQAAGLSDVPKAKSKGKCTYVHEFGAPPSFLRFILTQSMEEIDVNNFGAVTGNFTASHVREGFSVRWLLNRTLTEPGTQVFGFCPPGPRLYKHKTLVFIQYPGNWVYQGPNPIKPPVAYSDGLLECD